MYKSYSSSAQSHSNFARTEDAPVDGFPGPSTSPWAFKVSSKESEDGLPPKSQSWPPSAESAAYSSSFGTAGQELRLELDTQFEASPEPEPPESQGDEAWSPAAAFLSTFTPCASSTSPDVSGETVAGYVLGPTIGHGGFSTIRRATSPSGGVVAIKIVRHSAFTHLSPADKARQRSRLSHEARIWVNLSHENILPLFDSHRTAEATYLITTYCPAGSLFDILKREGTPALEQTDAGGMFRQVVKALQYLHESVGIVHGDVKLENVLVDETGVCRLADFGLARTIGGDSSQVSGTEDEDSAKPQLKRGKRSGTAALPVHLSLMRHGPQRHRNSIQLPPTTTPPTHPDHMFQPGSLPYAAPELLLPHSHSHNGDAAPGHSSRPTANPAQDMWALGVLLYALLTGCLPFRDVFEPRLQMKILRGTYHMPPAIGPLAESVLKGCLERDITERWTISMVDVAAWGIGYGNVELDPVLCEEQRSQSQSRSHSNSRRDRDLVTSMSSCSITSSAPADTPAPRGRPPRNAIRSQSRSLSPSPRTPDDEDDDATFLGRRQRRRGGVPRGEGDVHIVGENERVEWGSRDGVFDDGGAGAEADTATPGLNVDELGVDGKRVDGARGRQDA